MARSQLGIGPREPIVFGSASSGLVLWLCDQRAPAPRVQASCCVRASRLAVGARDRAAMLGSCSAPFSRDLVCGSRRSRHAQRSRFRPGPAVAVTDAFARPWELVNQGVSRFDAEGVFVTAVTMEARNPRGATALLTPEIREYHGRDGQHLAAGRRSGRRSDAQRQALRVLSRRGRFARCGERPRYLPPSADSLDTRPRVARARRRSSRCWLTTDPVDRDDMNETAGPGRDRGGGRGVRPATAASRTWCGVAVRRGRDAPVRGPFIRPRLTSWRSWSSTAPWAA